MPIAVEMEGALYAIHTDHLHTPRRLSDHQGNAVWQWVITGFGEMPATLAAHGFVPRAHALLPPIANETGQALPAVDFALRYPGQVHDNETGLFYNHHRYYDPYLTVGGDALGYVDPDGLRFTIARPQPRPQKLSREVNPSRHVYPEVPGRVGILNDELNPHRQIRREFPWGDLEEIIKKFPQEDVRCHVVCFDEDFLCKPFFMPANSYFTTSTIHPGCYKVCSTGPFLEPSTPKRPTLMTTTPGTRNATKGDIEGLLRIIKGK